MRVYRICRAQHARHQDDAFNGVGAGKTGQRWNPKGINVAYTSESASLALLEILAHADLEDLPGDLVCASVRLPENMIKQIHSPPRIPANWRDIDPAPPALAQLGEDWVRRGRYPVMRVPSVIVPWEYHYLINPAHPETAGLTDFEVETFSVDPRLGVGV